MGVLRNPRHEKFSQLVATGIKPAEAYTSLGYSKNGAPQSANSLLKRPANSLLKRPDVRARVDEILSVAAQSAAEQVSFDHVRVLNRLDVLSRRAEELGQISAAAKCEELIGRSRGMFVDRSVSTVWDGKVESLSAEQLANLIAELRKITGPDDPADENCHRGTALLPSADEDNDSVTAEESTPLLS
jgi:hypothetical protein